MFMVITPLGIAIIAPTNHSMT
jgi:hypothetical protein